MKVLGIDEAGRGPVLGPLVMVGFLIDEERIKTLREIGVKDSKLLTPHKREELIGQLEDMGEIFIRVIEPHQIDGFNLNRLEKIATRDIILEAKPDHAVIDAFEKRLEEKLALAANGYTGKVTAEHKADLKYAVVGAASIVAKVLRDREIEKLKVNYGDFGSGYPSDPKTARFVEELIKSKETLPGFVRKSWDTIRRVTEKEAQINLEGFLGP